VGVKVMGVTVNVTGVTVSGVTGVPPLAAAVSPAAVAVPLAKSSIIFIGLSADGNGATNKSGGIKVGVAAGDWEYDCVQAEIIITPVKIIIASLFLLYFICSPKYS
jgi:hypothetical protein